MEENNSSSKLFKISIPIFVFCFLFLNVKSQNQFGLTTSNYAGLYNLQINPANICYQPVTFDLVILGFDGYLNNNNFYAEPSNLFKLPFNNNFTKPILENRKFDPAKVEDGNFIIKSDIQNNGYAFAGANVMGPSVLFALNRKSSLAFTSSFRSQISGTNISSLTAQILFEGPSYSPVTYKQIKMVDTKVSLATWSEIGVSYARVIKENRNYIHRLGGTVKALFGIMGGYIYDRGYNGTNESGNALIFQNSNFSYGYAGPQTDNKFKNASSKDLSIKGLGASFDLGYSIQKNESAGIRYCPNMYGFGNLSNEYKWRAGISLLDIGAIQYFNSSFATNVNNGDLRWGKYDTIIKYDIRQIDATFRSYIGEKNTEIFNKFWMIMPAAISAQFDYKIKPGFMVNTTIVQRLTLAQTASLSRMNTVAVIPRFESEKVSIFMPFILNEYENFNLGLAVRYKFVTIGSDRFGETFGFQKLYGADLYAAFRYNFSKKHSKWKKLF